MSIPQEDTTFQVTTLDVEEQWGSTITTEGTYIFTIDLSALVDGDEVELRAEKEHTDAGGTYKDIWPSIFFFGAQSSDLYESKPFYLSTNGKIHIRQNGAAKRTMAGFLTLVE